MRTIIDKNTGQVLYGSTVEVELQETEMAIDELVAEAFENPYFYFQSRTFYEKLG